MTHRAIILAAGQGKRLRPITDDRPKCLVPLGEHGTVLDRQLDQCRAVGVREIVVLSGFAHERVEEALASWHARTGDVGVRTVYNPFFATTNNMISLWAARHLMDRDFLVINGDNVFRTEMLRGIVADDRHPILVPVAPHPAYDAEDMKVRLDGERILELNKQIALDAAHGESIGVRKFSGEGRALLVDELEAMAREPDAARAWFITAVERIAQRGGPVGVRRVADDDCMDVDFHDDLTLARRRFADPVLG